MRIATLVLLALALAASPVFAEKVYIDYDKDYDADQIKTFAWRTTPDSSLETANPLLHSRIINGLKYYITKSGKHEVETDPDVWVTYHASVREELAVNTTHYGYGYPGGWYSGYGYGYPGPGTSVSTVTEYKEGTLVVDVWDARTNKLVWRGLADNITVSNKPVKMLKRIDKALQKMITTWHNIKEKDAD